MSTPRYTKEGVKVSSDGFAYFCGHCGEYLFTKYGFPSEGYECPKCHTHNRPDFNFDLPSERLSDLAVDLERAGLRHDSVVMLNAAARLRAIIPDVAHTEDSDRKWFKGAGINLDEPAREIPDYPPELTQS